MSTKDQLDVREDRLLGRRRQVLAPAPERLEEATVLGAHLVLTHPKPFVYPDFSQEVVDVSRRG